MPKVLVGDPISEEGLKALKEAGGIEVDVKIGLSEDELVKCIGDYDALLVRSGVKVTAKVLESANKLKVVGRAGVGVDNVDVPVASKKGIIVMNTPGGNTISTAELTMTLMLGLVRKVGPAYISMRNKQWDRKKFQGVEVFGKTLGIVGLGRIGTEVAKRALSFGMKIVAYDPFVSSERAEKMDIEMADLDKLFKVSDIITVHTHITKETKGLIGAAAIEKMKKGVFIVNCARGGIVDETALLDAVKSGKVAGAALDVYENEPPTGSSLLEVDNILLTPHLGASTKEAQENVAVDVAYQVIDVLKGGPVRNAVNMPPIDMEQLKVLQPHITLGEKLGNLLAQLVTGQLEELKVEYSGEVAGFNVAPITIGVLKGVLGHVITEPINFINAPIIAKDRGIKIAESKLNTPIDFADLIHVTAITDGEKKGEVSVAGTLFGKNKDPRVVRINNYHVDAIPSGFVLIITNEDKPGVVGNVGVILGKNNVNIADMTLGRKGPGSHAVTVINVDCKVPDKVIEEIRNAPHIVDIKLVEL